MSPFLLSAATVDNLRAVLVALRMLKDIREGAQMSDEREECRLSIIVIRARGCHLRAISETTSHKNPACNHLVARATTIWKTQSHAELEEDGRCSQVGLLSG